MSQNVLTIDETVRNASTETKRRISLSETSQPRTAWNGFVRRARSVLNIFWNGNRLRIRLVETHQNINFIRKFRICIIVKPSKNRFPPKLRVQDLDVQISSSKLTELRRSRPILKLFRTENPIMKLVWRSEHDIALKLSTLFCLRIPCHSGPGEWSRRFGGLNINHFARDDVILKHFRTGNPNPKLIWRYRNGLGLKLSTFTTPPKDFSTFELRFESMRAISCVKCVDNLSI